MATMSETYKALAPIIGLLEVELAQVVRSLQAASLLPLVKRGRRANPPNIAARHCATLLIGIACSRPAGMRMAMALGPRVRSFKRLKAVWPPDGCAGGLGADLTWLIEQHRDPNWVAENGDSWRRARLVFITNEHRPEVCIELPARKILYRRPTNDVDVFDDDPAASCRCVDSFLMGGGVFAELGRLLGYIDPKAKAA